ncbi:MAG TPA: hypothetical protein PKO33_09465, partial [Pyrinomonadaceae bacterium]|nr:hypothetical protein [Pyrinomonadaceae bacterium]
MLNKRLICLFAIVLGTVIIAAAQKSQSVWVPDEVLVKPSKGTADRFVGPLAERVGASLLETLGDSGWIRVRIPEGMSVEEALKKFRETGEIEAAQPNFYYRLDLTPNDPQFPNSGMYGLTKISAPAAWDLTTGSPTVVVADIDTGLRYTHEDLAANEFVAHGLRRIPG